MLDSLLYILSVNVSVAKNHVFWGGIDHFKACMLFHLCDDSDRTYK